MLPFYPINVQPGHFLPVFSLNGNDGLRLIPPTFTYLSIYLAPEALPHNSSSIFIFLEAGPLGLHPSIGTEFQASGEAPAVSLRLTSICACIPIHIRAIL